MLEYNGDGIARGATGGSPASALSYSVTMTICANCVICGSEPESLASPRLGGSTHNPPITCHVIESVPVRAIRLGSLACVARLLRE